MDDFHSFREILLEEENRLLQKLDGGKAKEELDQRSKDSKDAAGPPESVVPDNFITKNGAMGSSTRTILDSAIWDETTQVAPSSNAPRETSKSTVEATTLRTALADATMPSTSDPGALTAAAAKASTESSRVGNNVFSLFGDP